jgi:hypothetical protein
MSVTVFARGVADTSGREGVYGDFTVSAGLWNTAEYRFFPRRRMAVIRSTCTRKSFIIRLRDFFL